MLSSLSSSLSGRHTQHQQSFDQVYPQLPGLPNQGPLQPWQSVGQPQYGSTSQYPQQHIQPGQPSQQPTYGQPSSQSQVYPYQSQQPPSSNQPGSSSWSQQHQSGSMIPSQPNQVRQQPPYGSSTSAFGQYAGSRAWYPASLVTSSMPTQQLQTVSPDEDPVYGPIFRASSKIERALQGDQEISPDLMDTLAGAQNDNLYSALPGPSQAFRPLQIIRNIPLPDELLRELNEKDASAKMGLFEDIDRAWFAIDNKLFLWDYSDGRSFSRYDEQADNILSVGLVKAKKDVFLDEITHVLLICTATRVSILAISRPSAREINLHGCNMSADLPTAMLQIEGTASGRIFMRGDNKDLYELQYQSEATGWFWGNGSRVNVINRTSGGWTNAITPAILSSRQKEGIEQFTVEPLTGRLFTLHTRGQIEYYDVSNQKWDLKSTYSSWHMQMRTNQMIRPGQPQQTNQPDPMKIVSIGAIGRRESARLGLVAVTANGTRAYFELLPFRIYVVRPPPREGLLLNEQSLYSFGTLLAAQPDRSAPTPTDHLHIITANTGRLSAARENMDTPDPSAGALSEWFTTDIIPSRIWTMAETPYRSPANAPATLQRSDGISLSAQPRQATTEMRTFLVLTESGIFIFAQKRPLEMLHGGLETERDTAISIVSDRFGKTQLSAMGVTLGAREDLKNQNIASAITQILLVSSPPMIRNESTGRTMVYSSRHDGLAMTMARLLRPIWSLKVTRTTPATPTTMARQVLGCTERELVEVQGRLEQLRSYVEANPFPRMQAEGDAKIAWDQEDLSLHSLQVLLKQTIEAISFVLLLNDHKLSDVVAKCEGNLQSTLANLSWRDLFVTNTGRDVAKRLVTALIEQQIGQEEGIDVLSQILQQRCGTFVQPGDVVLYKAEESMRKAEGSKDIVERNEALAEALRLYSRAGATVFPHIQDITRRFRALRYSPGAIELPLRTAFGVDPQDKAHDFVREGRNSNDQRKIFLDRRQECYSCAIAALHMYDESTAQAEVRNTGWDDAAAKRDEAYALAFASDDELFHYYLYDWVVDMRQQDQLLDMETPFIEGYLRMTSNDIADRRDLLWKWYARREEYLLAARAQFDLATRPSLMSLDVRTTYLAHALASAKSAAFLGADDVEFVSHLQERLDVALVQQEVQRGIENHPDIPPGEKNELLIKLQSNVLGLDELYQTFARPYRLYHAILLILKTADTRVDDVCETVWRQLLQPPPGAMAQAAVEEKVIDLLRRYFPSEAAPVDIVLPVVYTEAFNFEGESEEGWASRALAQGGVPLRDCWEAVMVSRDQAESEAEKDFYLEEAGAIAELWSKERDSVPMGEVERFITSELLKNTQGRMTDKQRKARDRLSRAKAALGRF